jgi:6-phosphofructokinase 1
VVVAEGFTPAGDADDYTPLGAARDGRMRLGGIGERIAPIIEELSGVETRATTLGHIQRGGTPTAFDRVLATRMGMAASDLVAAGAWDQMPALRGTNLERVPMSDALQSLKTVTQERYDEAAILFG